MNKKQLKALAVPIGVALAMLIFTWVTGDSDSPKGDDTDQSAQVRSNDESATSPSINNLSVPLSELPQEAVDTWQLISSGGPYPYDQDDSTFGNFEGLLPDQSRGYYREYTIETPGVNHRGARRFVVGDGGEVYYTQDHYESFELVDTQS